MHYYFIKKLLFQCANAIQQRLLFPGYFFNVQIQSNRGYFFQVTFSMCKYNPTEITFSFSSFCTFFTHNFAVMILSFYSIEFNTLKASKAEK